MGNRLILLCLLPMLASCYRAGPLYTVSGVEVEGDQLHLILDRYWARGFYDAYWRSRTEYFEWALGRGEGGEDLKAVMPLLVCGGEIARFVRIRGTEDYVAIVQEGDKGKVLVVRPGQGSGERIADLGHFNLRKHAYAVTRSGRHLMLVTGDEVVIKEVASGKEVERSRASPLLRLREQIIDGVGRGFGPGSWWLSDDLRYVVVMSPEDFTGGEADAIAVKGLEVEADLLSHALVYDRRTERFERCSRRVRFDMERSRPPLVDVESINGELLLLYGARGPAMGILDMAGAVRHHTRMESRYSSVIDWAWRPEVDAVFVMEGARARTGLPWENDVRVYRWDYRNGNVQSRDIAFKRVKEAMESR